jgi:hypothetical protein
MKKTTALLIASVLVVPSVAAAQDLAPLSNLIRALGNIVALLVPILITIALVVFFWGLVRYLYGSGGKSNTAGAKDLMIWGLVTLFVMVSVWGIVRLAQNALGISSNTPAPSPQVLVPSYGGPAPQASYPPTGF